MTALMEMDFHEARLLKHEMGRAEHRTGEPDEFKGNPYLEYYCEQLDSWNYLEEIQRRGTKVPPYRFATCISNAEWAREEWERESQYS